MSTGRARGNGELAPLTYLGQFEGERNVGGLERLLVVDHRACGQNLADGQALLALNVVVDVPRDSAAILVAVVSFPVEVYVHRGATSGRKQAASGTS